MEVAYTLITSAFSTLRGTHRSLIGKRNVSRFGNMARTPFNRIDSPAYTRCWDSNRLLYEESDVPKLRSFYVIIFPSTKYNSFVTCL